MTAIQTLISEPWIGRLGWTLLHFLWQGTAIAVVYTTARFVFARALSPRSRYLLSCAALLAMAAAPPLTFLTISNGPIGPGQMASWTVSFTEWRWLPSVVVSLWAAGAFGFSLRLFGAFRFTRRLRATAHPAPPEWQRELERIAARMGRPFAVGERPVRLMGSPLVNCPAVIGYLQPLILVPVAFLTGLPADQIVALLAHEMAHIRRSDYIASVLQSIAEVVLFYHPAVWWVSGQIRAERELCCDDLAIAAGTDVLTYARALAELESRRPGRLQPQLAASGGSLFDRIQRLIEPAHVGAHELPGTGSAWAMILLWLVGAGAAALPAAQKPAAPAVSNFSRAYVPERLPGIPVPSDQSVSPLDSLVGQARKTLLFDPVFSAQLAPAPPAPGTGAQAQASARPRPVVEQVTVKNANGAIIEGLRQEDFIVTENDDRQNISFFDFENVERPTFPAPVAGAGAARTAVAPELAGQLRYKDHRLITLYFDMTAMPVPDRLRVLDAATTFVGTEMSPADMVCLMRYNGAGVEVLQDFTGDRGKLLSILATIAVGEPDLGLEAFSADHKLAALRAAAQMLGSLNERKSLVYFSSGLKIGGTDNKAMLRAAIVDAIRSGVSIWPVDPRAAASPSPSAAGQDPLDSLAAETGGKATLDSGDLWTAIVAAGKSINNYYIVGYSPANDTPDGKLRRITITLNGNTDAKLDYRPGYVAQKEFGPAANKEKQLEDALIMEAPVTDLSIAAEMNYFRLNNAEYFTPITLSIPGSDFALAKKNGAARTAVDLIAEIKDSLGTTVTSLRDTLEVALTDPTPAELAKRSITWGTGATLLPGSYSVKILARDSETGRIGTYLSTLTIPNLNRDQQVPITSVVLSSQIVDDARPAAAAQALNPLVQGGKRMIPNVTRVFSSRTDMYVYLQAFEKGATTAVPLMANVAFYKGAVKIMETSPLKVSDGLDPKSKMLPIRMDVALASLKPGEYDCQITVLDPATQKSAHWQSPVTIVP